MQYQWVDLPSELDAIVEQLNNSQASILDTEFIRVDTLYPKLGVLQINVNGQVYLIDGHLDLSKIWQSLFLAKQNIFHACSEDIDLIYYYAQNRPLNNIFDTQIAMAFLGYGMQVGYQAAIEKILGIQIEKDQTRSDWLARPLTEDQTRYAASDVYYLKNLAEEVIAQLKQKQLYDFVIEDCQNLCQALAKQKPPEQAYLDIANFRHSSRQLMQLKQLATWRELLVVKLNKPRSYILKNNTMNKLLERTPKNMQQLANGYELKPAVLREYGKEILRLLNDLPEKSEWPTRIGRPFLYSLDDTKTRIEQCIASVGQKLDIPPEVLMRKKWLSQLNEFVSCGHQDIHMLTPYLLGWRYQYLTVPLMEILQNDRDKAGLET